MYRLFINLESYPISGLLHVSDLPSDRYKFLAESNVLKGIKRGTSYRLGQKIQVQIIEKDIFNQLNFVILKEKYDLIFIDPPYKENKLKILIEKISLNKVLKKFGIIIIHRHKNENDEFNDNFEIIDRKIYGISKIIFGRLK